MAGHALDRARSVLEAAGISGVTRLTELTGGFASSTWLVTVAGGPDVVLKTAANVPPDLYLTEAWGLATLRQLGGLRTPAVLGHGRGHLILEALAAARSADPAFWEAAAHAVANLHAMAGPCFGWPRDGWLGLLPQRNPWTEDGHEFFARHRILRYLDEPVLDAALTEGDRRALERLCGLLPELVPTMPPVLTHGDLWAGNVVATHGGEPAFIDPAVSWTWADVDVSMLYCTPRPAASDRFFEVYRELCGREAGWLDHLPVLYLRELLADMAHGHNLRQHAGRVRETLRRFARQPA